MAGKSVSLLTYASFATPIDVKCEPWGSSESRQTSCKQVTEVEVNVLLLAPHIRFRVWWFKPHCSYTVHWFIVFMATNIRWLYSVRECQPCITIAASRSICVIYRKTHSVIKLFFFFRKTDFTSVLNDDCSATGKGEQLWVQQRLKSSGPFSFIFSMKQFCFSMDVHNWCEEKETRNMRHETAEIQ